MKRPELVARLLVLMGMAVAVLPWALRESAGVIEVKARMPELGGWSPESLQVEAGQSLRLRITSDDVTHGFAVGATDTKPVDVEPGRVTAVDLQFARPGRYTFYCTRWCGPNHWRMRGTIEVLPAIGADGPQYATPEPAPLYVTLGLDIDAPHPAQAVPAGEPAASNGRVLAADGLASGYLGAEYYRSHSPSAAFADLRAEAHLQSLTDAEIWDIVAHIWYSNATSAELQAGRQLYVDNCAACHGEGGAGDGIFADDLVEAAEAWAAASMAAASMEPQPPADFSDPARMLGASPALLQGKILRGGMGTSMPMWGSIFREQQLEQLVAYLYTFQFQESRE